MLWFGERLGWRLKYTGSAEAVARERDERAGIPAAELSGRFCGLLDIADGFG